MKVRFLTREEVAKKVGDGNNNPRLASQLLLYLIPLERAGIKFCVEVNDDKVADPSA